MPEVETTTARKIPDAESRAVLLRALTVWTGDPTAAEDLT